MANRRSHGNGHGSRAPVPIPLELEVIPPLELLMSNCVWAVDEMGADDNKVGVLRFTHRSGVFSVVVPLTDATFVEIAKAWEKVRTGITIADAMPS